MTESMFKLGQTYKTRDAESKWLVLYIKDDRMLALHEKTSVTRWYWTTGQLDRFDRRDGDLMLCTKEVTRYLNVYPNWVEDHAWADEVTADKYAGSDRIACIPYKVTLPDDDSEA